MDLQKLTELLEAEKYPHCYIHKFIGRKTPAFLAAVLTLEVQFPKAKRTGERESSSGSDTRASSYLALTYELTANSASEIIDLWQATAQLVDLKIIL